MKQAFTMVELIFVIVIIGILAAVAIPKLSATRDDAVNVTDCKNIAVCITDLAAEYTASMTVNKNSLTACKRAEDSAYNAIVFTITTGESVTVSGAPQACSRLNKTFSFGGTRVSF